MKRALSLWMLGLSLLLLGQVDASLASAKDWTVMFFINGDNNLEQHFNVLLQRIEREGPSARVNVLVKWDGLVEGDSKLLEVRKAILDSKIKRLVSQSVIIEENVEYDMGDPKALADFVSWSIEHYPARHYALMVSGHGRGILNIPVADGANFERPAPVLPSLAFSPDESSKNYMNEEDMVALIKRVLDAKLAGRKLDLFAYNSCLMGNVEVLATLAPITQFALASEYSISLYPGTDYDPGTEYETSTRLGISIDMESVLQTLNGNPSLSGKELGAVAVERYRDSYTKGAEDFFSGGPPSFTESTLVLYDLGEISGLKALMRTAVDEFVALGKADKNLIQRFYMEIVRSHMVEQLGYMDLGVMARAMARASELQSSWDLYNSVYFTSNFMLKRTLLHVDPEISGLSVFFTALSQEKDVLEGMLDFYSQLEVARETHWDDLVRYFFYSYQQSDYEITFDLLTRYMNGEKVIVRYDSGDEVENEKHLVRIIGWTQFKKDLLRGRADRLRAQLELIHSGRREGPVLVKYREELQALLTQGITSESIPTDYRQQLNALLSEYF